MKINRGAVALFLFISYGFTWGVWFAEKAFQVDFYIASFGSALAAVLASLLFAGKNSLKNLFNKTIKFRFKFS